MVIDVDEALRKVVREELEPVLQELKTIKTPQVQASLSGWHRGSEICAIKGISSTTFHRIKEQICEVDRSMGERSPRYRLKKS